MSSPVVDCSLCPSSTSLPAQRVSDCPGRSQAGQAPGRWEICSMRWWSELECPHRRRTASEWRAPLLGEGGSGPRATAARIPGHLHTMVRGSVTCHSVPSFCSQPPTNLSLPSRSVNLSRGGSDQLGKGLELGAGWASVGGVLAWHA